MGENFQLWPAGMSSPARTGCARQNSRLFSRVVPILAVAATLALSGCGDRNTFIPPPPPKIELASPLKQSVTRYLMATGNTAAVNTTTLVARVQGFIQSIDYNDGDFVKAGKTLFVIEQQPYQLSLEQAQAGLASAEAQTKKSKADYERQVDLAAKNISSQATLDAATATYDAAVAAQKQSQVNIDQAQLNLSYTEVKAPFDGIVTAREVSLGQLVGAGSPTTLATIVQLQPIYVNFYVSESDVQSIRDNIRARAITAEELKKIPVEVGLQSETGYPHKGTLDYAAPTITANTGTLLVRGVFQNENKSLLPGYFVRVRVPRGKDNDALLVPDRVVGSDQAGRYVFVANKDDIIEQRKVVLGQQVGDLRVIEKGLAPDDRVVISGLMTVVPGQKIEPVVKTISAPAPDADTAQ
ncbi:efflux RND transporter periplasmic adaptor subunit [Hyphomicrobium sp. MC1]|uniref:efflux RND transporter periplasmic adaptor subunit n=1 Tax=Hyphomicrobium sp. (strain MC1) TaxID=717785 RepID=UPI000213F1D7|nr:efflux RND transporter periplasmic adaptor subunit [Hyphomicrobium sp. MC1]CCB64888.1 Efflux transporter, RND family, MFP subunit [Hyphomicrobium sp. MC1]